MYCMSHDKAVLEPSFFSVPAGYTTDVKHIFYSMFIQCFLLRHKNMFVVFFFNFKIYVFTTMEYSHQEKIDHIACMPKCIILLQMSHAAWSLSVCLWVCKNDRTSSDAVVSVDLCRNHEKDGARGKSWYHNKMEQFREKQTEARWHNKQSQTLLIMLTMHRQLYDDW